MSRTGAALGALFMAVIATNIATPVQARPAQPWHQPPAYQHLAQGLSLDAAIQQAQQRFGGRVVRANTLERNGNKIHRIRLVNRGRVRDVLINAHTGEFMRPAGPQGEKR